MTEGATVDNNNKMYTFHGRKKFQGVWMKINHVPSLTFISDKGEVIDVQGYTTIDEMMKMAYSPDLPEITL
jgi:hypothetical protein